MRLDAYLASVFPALSRSEWSRRITEEKVLVAGRKSKPSGKIFPGVDLRYDIGDQLEPEVNTDFRIIHEDEEILVIDKPENLPVHTSFVYKTANLVDILRRQRPEAGKIHLVNRLDRVSSGIVLFAKTPEMAALCFENIHRFEKDYLVAVFGDFPESLDAKGYIGSDLHSRIRKKNRFSAEPQSAEDKTARTEFHLLENRNGISILRARLHSGRTHQIRATLCSLGYPLLGDPMYGPDENFYLKFISDQLDENDYQQLGCRRTLLHAWKLRLILPGKKALPLQTEVPEEFRKLGFTG